MSPESRAGRSTPVGPPWMTHNKACFLAGSKSAGLMSTPSITVPSLLFQEMTSRVPRVQPATWSVIRVRRRGFQGNSETPISASAAAAAVWKATRFPSLEKLKPESMASSGVDMREICRDPGSRR